jgi:transaldolase
MNVLEKLAATNPDCEIWWDSSPMIYSGWKASVLKDAPAEKRTDWEAQLTRLFDAEHVSATGEMGFRGVTTNPPLSLQAIQADPAFWADEIRSLATASGSDDIESIYWNIYLDVVRRGAAMIRKVYEVSGGKYGLVSGRLIRGSSPTGRACLNRACSLPRSPRT